jgi:NACalpha-BTF3-like transcription factor
MTYPGAGIAVSTGSAWGTSLTTPAGTIVGTTDTQTLTNKTVDGVTPTTMGYVDPTSSIQTQLNGKQASGSYVVQTTTVNSHPLSSNVTVSASDLTTGTLPHAQLPTLLSGDIPNNAANTSGNAATATALASAPTTCTTGNAPTGILANGNATGCASIGGGGGLPDFANVSGSNDLTSTSSTVTPTYQGGQDASANSALGGVVLRGADETGAGGSSSAGGSVLIRGGNNAATNASSQSGHVEISAGMSTGASTPGNNGLLLLTQVFKLSGTYAQWNIYCTTSTAMTVSQCGPYSSTPFIGVAVSQPTSTTVKLALSGSTVPVAMSSGATIGYPACAQGGTTGLALSNGFATQVCMAPSVGVVEATSGTWPSYPDGTTFPTLSSTLALVTLLPQPPFITNAASGGGNVLKQNGNAGTSVTTGISENGSQVYTSEPIFGGNGSMLTTATTGIGNSSTSTGVAFPATGAIGAKFFHGICKIIYQQTVGISTVTWQVQTSAATTALYTISKDDSGSYRAPIYTGPITTATTTNISGADAPTAFGTNYDEDIDVIDNQTNVSQTISIYALSGSGTDTITIQPGSYCAWEP